MKKWINFLEIATVFFLILHIVLSILAGSFTGVTTSHLMAVFVIGLYRFNMWWPDYLDDLRKGHEED